MSELEEQKEEKIQEKFENKKEKKIIDLEDGTENEEEQNKENVSSDIGGTENQDVFTEFVDVIKSKFNDHNINIIMGDYVRQNHGVITGENARLTNTNFAGRGKRESGNIKKADQSETDALFDDENKICSWMKGKFGNESFLWLISMSVFHDMPYNWIKTNAGLLKSRKIFGEGNEDLTSEIKTKDELLKSIGALTYMDVIILNGGEVEVEFVGFADENTAEKILKSLWTQFTDYREGLLDWLKLFAYQAELTQSYAAIQAISFLAQLDYYYFETHMLQKLVSDDNTAALAEILHLISQNKKYTDKINKIAKHWGTLSKCSYLLSALSLAQKNQWNVSEIEPIMSKYIDGTINAVRKTWREDYLQNFPIMFIIGQKKSSYYKAMIAAVYKRRYVETKKYGNMQKENAEQIFLMMVETDFEYTRAIRGKKREMLLVNMLFIKNEYAQMLTELWRQLWEKHSIHAQVKTMMITYWKQKCHKDFGYERQMKQFFNKIGVSEREQCAIYKNVLGGNGIWIQ